MPTYEYKCKKCNKTFEQLQSINEDALKSCIYCDGQVNRVFHPVGIVFKGSGFYTTDNRKSGVGSRESGEKPKKESKKEEDKPAACANKDNCAAAANCN